MNKRNLVDVSSLDLKDPKIWGGCYVAIFLGGLLFYLYYALHAWFCIDDFRWIQFYASNLNWTDIYNLTNNFGRFISRNLYWHIFLSIFGKNSTLFFITNLLIIITNSFIIYKFFLEFSQDKFLSVSISTIYFTGLPTIANYRWISNAEHLLAQTFLLSFLYFLVKYPNFNSRNIFYKLILLFLFICSLYSSIANICALPILIIYLLLSKNKFYHTIINYLFILLLLLIISFFTITLMEMATGPYHPEISFSTFIINLGHYITKLSRLTYDFSLVCQVTVSIIIICCVLAVLAVSFKNKEKRVIFLIAASISLYLPFAFAVHHRTVNYISIPYIFIIFALLYLLRNHRKLILLFVIISFCTDMPHMRYYAKYPWGTREYEFVHNLNKIDKKGYNTIYLKPTEKDADELGKTNMEIPLYWWSFGLGSAFTVFSDPEKNYRFYSKNCDLNKSIIIEIDKHFSIADIIYCSGSQSN